jgi:hypothetical protein
MKVLFFIYILSALIFLTNGANTKITSLEPKEIIKKIELVKNSIKLDKAFRQQESSSTNVPNPYNDILIGILKGFLNYVQVDTTKYNDNVNELTQAAIDWLTNFFTQQLNQNMKLNKQSKDNIMNSQNLTDASLTDDVQVIIENLINSLFNSTNVDSLFNDPSVFEDLSNLFNQLINEIVKYFLSSLGINLNIDDNNYKEKYLTLVSELKKLVDANSQTEATNVYDTSAKNSQNQIGSKLALISLKLMQQTQQSKKELIDSSIKSSLEQLGKQAEQFASSAASKIPTQQILSNAIDLIKKVDDLKNNNPTLQSNNLLLQQLRAKPKTN